MKKLLCWLGFHKWNTFSDVRRCCDWCKQKQSLYAASSSEQDGHPRFVIMSTKWKNEDEWTM